MKKPNTVNLFASWAVSTYSPALLTEYSYEEINFVFLNGDTLREVI